MASKKKFTISLIVAAVVLLIAIIAIVSVAAVSNQNISSNVKIHYKASSQVIGYVSATYSYGDKTDYMTTNGKAPDNLNNYVWFAYKEKPTAKSMQIQSADLSDGKLNVFDYHELVFAFNFTNTGYDDFTVTLNVDAIKSQDNLLITYSIDQMTWSTDIPSFEVPSPTGLAEMSSRVCYIKLTVDDIATDAKFDGTFVWNLLADDAYLD